MVNDYVELEALARQPIGHGGYNSEDRYEKYDEFRLKLADALADLRRRGDEAQEALMRVAEALGCQASAYEPAERAKYYRDRTVSLEAQLATEPDEKEPSDG